MGEQQNNPGSKRVRIVIRGAVQGVGFRPFVYRLATELALRGWISNSSEGVFLEAEGTSSSLERLLSRLHSKKPPRAYILSLETTWLDPVGYSGFEIRASTSTGEVSALVLPDIATCPDCLAEITDPANRRYGYPFTNCTNCGPRFTIIESLPYDRPNTSMKMFAMCPACRAEYENPSDRRFHAQPNACPVCGPHLELWDAEGKAIRPGSPEARSHEPNSRNQQALAAAAEAIRKGSIVAVKGVGGFHLMVAAHDEQAVTYLRTRKHREEKPLAVMFPSLDQVRAVCQVSAAEERLLQSPETPIVLLRRKRVPDREGAPPTRSLSPSEGEIELRIAPSVSPANPYLGVMLPYSPLHYLLLQLLGFAVVATSGNLSDEPICIEEREAVSRLRGIADLFLVHNRPIVRHVDDSIVRVIASREMVVRRARGFAPLPVPLPGALAEPARRSTVLAVGAHLKNVVALSIGSNVFVSQHIGDLETEAAFAAFQRSAADLQKLYGAHPDVIAADLHPDYLSTRFARAATAGPGAPRLCLIQHHMAHAFSCMAENDVSPPLLGVSWDGTGYGSDGTIWGGEFFLVSERGWERVAHLRPFRLPGGDQAVKEPRRTALGLLYEIFGTELPMNLTACKAFSPAELASLLLMLKRQLNSPVTSSVGRLFDAVAALIGLRSVVRFEGQAAMELEFALEGVNTKERYDLRVVRSQTGPAILDGSNTVRAILEDVNSGMPAGVISAKFHNTLAQAVVDMAKLVRTERVLLSGGCFQNRYLTERCVQLLREAGLHPYWHQRVPPNDGGIALGQVVGALRSLGTAV